MDTFLLETHKTLEPQMKRFIDIHTALKINTEIGAQFIVKEQKEIQMKYFNTKNVCIYKVISILGSSILTREPPQPDHTDIDNFWVCCST